jgi:hypothetical protein
MFIVTSLETPCIRPVLADKSPGELTLPNQVHTLDDALFLRVAMPTEAFSLNYAGKQLHKSAASL